MATRTLWAVDPLEEAAAIIEAEWMRVLRDRPAAAHDVADVPADEPSRQPIRDRLRIATDQLPQRLPVPCDRNGWLRRRRGALPVWPTQRSPPAGAPVDEM